MLSSSGSNAGLFRTPEETSPPQVLLRANELAHESSQVAASALLELRNNRQLLENHLTNLPAGESRTRGKIDPHLAIARAKIEDAETFDDALGYLTARETFAVLNSPTMLRAVFALPRGEGRK